MSCRATRSHQWPHRLSPTLLQPAPYMQLPTTLKGACADSCYKILSSASKQTPLRSGRGAWSMKHGGRRGLRVMDRPSVDKKTHKTGKKVASKGAFVEKRISKWVVSKTFRLMATTAHSTASFPRTHARSLMTFQTNVTLMTSSNTVTISWSVVATTFVTF